MEIPNVCPSCRVQHLACIGWSAVNATVGAQLLHAINPKVPPTVGVLAIVVSTSAISMFSYKVVQAYERWSWIPILAVFLVVLGQFAHSGRFESRPPLLTEPVEAASKLSFASAVYGFATEWCTFAADYTVYQPSTRSSGSVFAWTFGSLYTPLVSAELLGAAVSTATLNSKEHTDTYQSSGIGGVLAQVLIAPLGTLRRVLLGCFGTVSRRKQLSQHVLHILLAPGPRSEDAVSPTFRLDISRYLCLYHHCNTRIRQL